MGKRIVFTKKQREPPNIIANIFGADPDVEKVFEALNDGKSQLDSTRLFEC